MFSATTAQKETYGLTPLSTSCQFRWTLPLISLILQPLLAVGDFHLLE
jgi:hypothetical protein